MGENTLRKKRKGVWDFERRKQLETLAKQGYTVSAMVEKLDVSRTTILLELKKGMPVKLYNEKRYVTYSARAALISDVIDNYGGDAVQEIHDYVEEMNEISKDIREKENESSRAEEI